MTTEPFKDSKTETNYYQLICVGLFIVMIACGYKYNNLKREYAKAEKEKIEFCKEVQRLNCELKNK